MNGPGHWQSFLVWMEINRVGDLSGVMGIFISLIGFAVTLIGVVKSKSAAQRAEAAARATRDSINLLTTVVDFTFAISALEEIKRLHRAGQWVLLPDRYAALRKILVSLRNATVMLSNEQQASLQNALTNLYATETAVERALESGVALKAAKFNVVMSRDIDALLAALVELQNKHGGA
jgi:hypothetical protein